MMRDMSRLLAFLPLALSSSALAATAVERGASIAAEIGAPVAADALPAAPAAAKGRAVSNDVPNPGVTNPVKIAYVSVRDVEKKLGELDLGRCQIALEPYEVRWGLESEVVHLTKWLKVSKGRKSVRFADWGTSSGMIFSDANCTQTNFNVHCVNDVVSTSDADISRSEQNDVLDLSLDYHGRPMALAVASYTRSTYWAGDLGNIPLKEEFSFRCFRPAD